MIVSDDATPKNRLKELRAEMDAAVLSRLKACGDLEPYSEKWKDAYYKASVPLFAVQQKWRDILWAEYQKIWGVKSSGSYFFPQHTINREAEMSRHRVAQRLAK